MAKYKQYREMSYTEIPQISPIRWEICAYDKETDTYIAQTGRFKCRDFFNDIVAKYHGFSDRIYGFDTSHLDVSSGFSIRVSYIPNLDQFLTNVDTVLNTDAPRGAELKISICEGDSEGACVVDVPVFFLKNTYRLSRLTYLLRICAYDVELPSLNWTLTNKYSPAICLDTQKLSENRAKKLLHYGWDLPKLAEEFWYYYNSRFNSKNEVSVVYVHGCGMVYWVDTVAMWEKQNAM